LDLHIQWFYKYLIGLPTFLLQHQKIKNKGTEILRVTIEINNTSASCWFGQIIRIISSKNLSKKAKSKKKTLVMFGI